MSIKLNKFIENYFQVFSQSDMILNTYNQFLKNIAKIIENFKFEYTYKNDFNEIITIIYNLKDESDQIKQINKQDLINSQQCRDRQTDLMQHFLFDMTFEIKKVSSDNLSSDNLSSDKSLDNLSNKDIIYIHSDNKFKFELPILSGTYADIVNQMSDLQKWTNGLDINAIGGDLILSGVKYILPNLFSFPFNKPIVVTADKQKQVVRAEYLRQTNPIFGNSYYIAYHIVEDKDKNPDIVVYLKQNHDQRFNKDNKKTTPIYVPILLLFYIYGIKNDLEFIQICNKYHEKSFELFLINCIRHGEYHKNLIQRYPDFRNNPKELLAKYILIPDFYDHIDQILEKYVHPLNSKFFIILQDVIYKMYLVYNDPSKQFDKDSLLNKRVKTVSEQVVEQLRSRMNENYKSQMLALERNKLKHTQFKDIVTLKQDLQNIAVNEYSDKITKTMKRSFTSPNSSIQNSSLRKVQNEYYTINYDYIQKREIVIRSEGKGKVTWHQCKVQNSYFGFIDTVQTPEAGANVGRYLSPTTYAQITDGYDTEPIKEFLEKQPLFIKDLKNFLDFGIYFPVKINYITYGFVKWDDMKELYNIILHWKNLTNPFLSVYFSIEHQELIILSDMGRLMVPILHGVSSLEELNETPIEELLKQEKIIFVCPEMVTNFIIQQSPDISVSVADETEQSSESANMCIQQKAPQFKGLIYDKNLYYFLPYGTTSPITSNNPFINHMKSVRASYSCPQQKQGITCPNTNFINQFCNSQYIIHKLQHPPVQTLFSNTLYKHIPLGNLVNLAIMEYCHNQEDAIITSNEYFLRGGLQISEYHTIQMTLSSNKNIFTLNQEIYEKHKDKYHLINTDYCIPDHIGEKFNQNDVLIASIINSNNEQRVYNQTFDDNVNTKYKLISNVNSNYLIKSQTSRMTRIQLAKRPNIGDKFIPRNAQKGTIGKIYHEYELPIDEYGIMPNFITSSQSILKRETYGQLIEPLLNIYLCQTQQYRLQMGLDERFEQQKLIDKLSYIQPSKLLNPISGVQANASSSEASAYIINPITTGPVTYIPYRHLVDNKIWACNECSIDQITKQPLGGRKNNGALQLGSLDFSSLFTQGIANTMRHQIGQNSSKTQWYFCKECSLMTVYKDKITNKYFCSNCQKYLEEKNIGYGSYDYSTKFYNDVLYSVGLQLQLFEKQ